MSQYWRGSRGGQAERCRRSVAVQICPTLYSTREERPMPGPSVQEVEQRLGALKGASCKGSSFGIDHRFMQADGEWRGVCKKCFYSFPLYTDMEFYLRTQPDVPYRLTEISCTACNHRGVSLDFRATMSVRESIYFVTCGGCQRQFAENSSLEAFE